MGALFVGLGTYRKVSFASMEKYLISKMSFPAPIFLPISKFAQMRQSKESKVLFRGKMEMQRIVASINPEHFLSVGSSDMRCSKENIQSKTRSVCNEIQSSLRKYKTEFSEKKKPDRKYLVMGFFFVIPKIYFFCCKVIV